MNNLPASKTGNMVILLIYMPFPRMLHGLIILRKKSASVRVCKWKWINFRYGKIIYTTCSWDSSIKFWFCIPQCLSVCLDGIWNIFKDFKLCGSNLRLPHFRQEFSESHVPINSLSSSFLNGSLLGQLFHNYRYWQRQRDRCRKRELHHASVSSCVQN